MTREEHEPSPPVCAADRPFSEAEVGETAGVTSQLPRTPVCLSKSKITSPGRGAEARQQKRCPEKERGRLSAPVFWASSMPYLYISFLQEFLDVASAVINNQSSEFNQSGPHCFPRKSSSVGGSGSSLLPASASQLLPKCISSPSRSHG